MAEQREHSAYILVPSSELEDLHRSIDELKDMVSRAAAPPRPAKSGYVEPGPNSPRKWFTVAELVERLGFQKSKIYALTELELPSFQHGGSGKVYFWAYVWAFERRITREVADDLYHAHTEVQNALQARTSVLRPVTKPARIR